jgi:5'/3'-nucleotidase SurE
VLTKQGSSDTTPTQVDSDGCEFQSCPPNSPATGSNSSDPRLNYVNGYPVTSIKAGINTFGPRQWNGAAPEFAVTGPNVGENIGPTTFISGTVGAAVYAAQHGIPSIAFSGRSGDPTAWNQPTPVYSKVYADLALKITNTILASSKPYLPAHVFLNVNFPTVSSTQCNDASKFKFVLTRVNSGLLSARDVEWCGTDRLPWEVTTIFRSDCWATISVGDANDKTTADAIAQAQVLPKLQPILSCLP